MAIRPRIVRTTVPGGEGDDVMRDDLEEEVRDDVEEPVDPDFDETLYLRAFPDVAEAVRRGMLASGLDHYRRAGQAEARLEKPEYRVLRGAGVLPATPQVAVDMLTISASGATLITGWCDDRNDPLTEINLATRADTRHNWTAFPRLVRTDVQRTL